MSEEIFPGFKFSVFSYVVSLLRPEIIRDLDLPRHGLHMLPLESTLTPLRTATTSRSGTTTTRTGASSRATRRATPRPTTSSAA